MSEERKKIRGITRTKTTLDGTESFAGQDDTGDFQALAQKLADLIATEETPVGTIIPYDSLFPSIPAIGDKWQDCDGTVIPAPTGSVFAGYRTRNLNGASVVLSIEWVADGAGSYGTVPATDLIALNVGDTVTGTGISAVDGQSAMIIDITGSSVTINDTAAAGIIASTFTNQGIYIGGGEGSAFDTLQYHYHEAMIQSVGSSGGPGIQDAAAANSTIFNVPSWAANTILTNASDGTPRTGPRTRPHTRFLKYTMKIK